MVHAADVPPMDLDFNISWCDRVREWTLSAHWLSETSPRKAQLFSPPAKPLNASVSIALQSVTFRMTTPLSKILNLGYDNELHVHAFVFFAANHRTDDLILT